MEIEDRLERIGSSMIYDIVANGGHEAFEKLVLKIPTTMNDLMERGVRFELPVMQWAADSNGWAFEPADTLRWEQDGVPYRDTPDFWIKTNGKKILAEVKTHNMWIREQYGDEHSEDVPDRVFCQAQFHCAANDAEECRVIPSFGGEKPLVYVVRRDRTVWKNIHAACVKFWKEHVETKIPPPADGTDGCTNLLNRRVRNNDDMMEALTEDVAKHYRLAEVKAGIKGLTAEKNEISNYFKERIGENLGIQNDAIRYTWKKNKDREVINYDGLLAEANLDPELIAKYTRTVEGSRVLKSLKPKKVK